MGIFRHKKQLRSNLSPEDLAKTQVINLKDVEAAAKYEKTISKKPAMIVGTIGLFAIAIGLLYNPIYNMINTRVEEPSIKQRVQEKVVTPKDDVENITCTLNMNNASDGTDSSVVVNLRFKEKILQGYVRTYTDSPNKSHPEVQASVTKLMNDFKAFEKYDMAEGYKIKTDQLGNGFTVVTTVDFTKLDITKLNKIFGVHKYARVDHTKDTKKDEALKFYTDLKYICQ